MTTRYQYTGGSAEQEDSYIGLPREITVDEDNHSLRLHDGSIPGGHHLENRDTLDARFQAKSAELKGLDFRPEGRGFVTRVGPGTYALRSLKAQLGRITVVYPNGFDGDPVIGLPETIVGDIGIDGQLSVSGAAEILGGLNADTSGTHFGAVVGDAAGNHTGSFAGDLDVRGQTIQFDADQIPFAAVNGIQAAIVAALDALIPVGTIVSWYGDETSIPAPWVLCDGANGTPDMRGKYVRAAHPGTIPALATGGALTHTHDVDISSGGGHNHAITVDGHVLTQAEMPSHQHAAGVGSSVTSIFAHGSAALAVATANSIQTDAADGTSESLTTLVGDGLAHNHTATSAADGAHVHGAVTQAGSSLPPFIAMIFMMKL